MVNGQWVELSDSLIKTRAEIEPEHKTCCAITESMAWWK